MNALTYWRALPTWERWTLTVIGALVALEACSLAWRAFVRWFDRTLIGAIWADVRRARRQGRAWNYQTPDNLPLSRICEPYGAHVLVEDVTPERELNPHALAMTGYCSRCFQEWKRDPQGLNDGWTKRVRPRPLTHIGDNF